MDMPQPAHTSPEAQQVRHAAPRRDRRWLTLTILLILIPIVTALRLWPLLWAYSTIEGIETFSNLSRDHQSGPLAYPQTPPVGGAHSATWQNCGIYDQVIPNETAVHSLEHGAVWITYRTDLSIAEVEQLRTLVRGRPYALLSPYPDQPAPVVATAWGVQLRLDSASDARLAKFIGTYMQGTQTPELGALCSGGGVGMPVGR